MSNVTPHEMESSDDESASDLDIEPESSLSFGNCALNLWKSRSAKLHHDYSIAGWTLCVAPEVREHVAENMTPEHREAIERVVRRLHVVPCPNKDAKVIGKNIEEIVDLFWDEFKCFEKKTKPFDNAARWSTPNAVQGKSYLWHENTHCLTQVFWVLLLAILPPRLLGLGHVSKTGQQSRTLRQVRE